MTTRVRLLVSAAGLVILVVVGGVALWAMNPVGDEWQCSPGEAPADNPQGGSDCFAIDADLPQGWSWDPLGNRPLECDGDDWVAVQGADEPQLTDCASRHRAPPDGWVLADG